MQIRNISPGPRGVHLASGPVLLAPGQSIEADMRPAEHASSYATGWFDMPVPEVAGNDDDDDGGPDRANLVRPAADLGIECAKTSRLKSSKA